MGSSTSDTAREGQGEARPWRALLHEYAAAVALGQPARSRFPELARHLDECIECQEELAELVQLIEPLYDGTLEPAGGAPAFDMRFLSAPAEPAALGRALRRIVVALDDQLDLLRRRLASAGARPALLQVRGSASVEYAPDPETLGGAAVLVQLSASEEDPERCDLQVAIVLPDGNAPDGVTVVTLSADGQEWQQELDPAGLCAFPGLLARDALSARIEAEVQA